MKNHIDLTNHISVQSTNKITKIIQPIKDTFGVKYFRYLKLFHDKSRIILTNNPDGVRYLYEEGNYAKMWFDGEFQNFLNPGWYSWKTNRSLEKNAEDFIFEKDLINLLQVNDGLTFIRHNIDSDEIFTFDSDNTDIYFVDKNLLEHFTIYFKDQAHPLIQASETQKIIVPSNMTHTELEEHKQPHNEHVCSFLKHTHVNRYYLSGKYSNIYLTKKELRCLHWLIMGKSTKETAKIENNDPRTIQTHIENIKLKLNCQKQTQLITAALEGDIMSIINIFSKYLFTYL